MSDQYKPFQCCYHRIKVILLLLNWDWKEKDQKSPTWIASITASGARKRVMWLVRLKGAVSQRPGGTVSWPPPLSANLEMALTPLSNASVLRVTPSPTPPNSVKQKTTGRSFGGGSTGTPPSTRNPLMVFLCQTKSEASAATQRNAKRVLWEAKGGVLGLRRNQPSTPEFSTIVGNWLRYVGCFENCRGLWIRKWGCDAYVGWFLREVCSSSSQNWVMIDEVHSKPSTAHW